MLRCPALSRLYGPNCGCWMRPEERGEGPPARSRARVPPPPPHTPSSFSSSSFSCLPSAPSPVYSLTQCLKQHRRSPEESYSILCGEKENTSAMAKTATGKRVQDLSCLTPIACVDSWGLVVVVVGGFILFPHTSAPGIVCPAWWSCLCNGSAQKCALLND